MGLRSSKRRSRQAPRDSQSLQCIMCTKQFASKKLFATHRYFHRIESSGNLAKVDFEKEDFACTFCEISFTSMDKLGSHLSTHEETCKHCGEVYPNAFVLGVHLAEHDAGEQVCCPFCEFKGAHPYSYKNHLFTKHFKLKILRCDSCGASYSSKAHLEQHVRFIHKKMDPHKCVVCQRTFIFQSSLYKHQINSHRPFIDGDVPSNFCVKCKRTFITVESFQKHLVLIHSEVKRPSKPQEKYICDICGKDYSYRQSWLLHTKGHSGQLPYQCKSCPKSFRVKAFLTQHEKTHSNERPFNCEMCGNCFKRKEGLRRHLQTHTDVKPFGCSNCGKRFRRREHRRLHMNSCNKSCGVFTGSVIELSSFCDLCFKEFDAFSYHECAGVVTPENNNLLRRHCNAKWAENDDQIVVIDITLESDSEDCTVVAEKDLYVIEDADYKSINGEPVDPSKSHSDEVATLESSPKTKEAEIDTGPCKAGKILFTEISAPNVHGTLVKPRNSYISKNDIGIIVKSNSKAVDGKTPKELQKSEAHGLSAKKFKAANGLSAKKTCTDQSPLKSSEKALPIAGGSETPQSKKCPGNGYSHAETIDVILPKIIPEEEAFTGSKNDESSSGIKEASSGIEKMSGEKGQKNFFGAIKGSGTMQKRHLTNDKSSKASDELPNREMNDTKINKAGAELKNPKPMLNTKKFTKNLEKSFAKKEKGKSPTQNYAGHQESFFQTSDTTHEVTPVGSAEVTKPSRLESVGEARNPSILQAMTSVKANQESKPSKSRKKKRKRRKRKISKTPIPFEGTEASSSKPSFSLPLLKGESPAGRKSNFSTQKKLEKSTAIFMCALCDSNFKLKGDVMIHYIMRHHCEAPESSLLPVKTKKSTMGPGKNLPDVALKTNEGYVGCENRGTEMGDLPMKKLKQQKIVTLQQYKDNRTFFNSKYDSDSSGSSTSLENHKSNNFQVGAMQGKAKKVLTLQQYKAMKSSKFKCSWDGNYCSSSTGTAVRLEENLNQSALQETKVARFPPEPDPEGDCFQRDSPSYCEVCGLQIYKSSSYDYHMKIVHPGFALKCFVCGTSCGNFDSLIKHHRKHSEFQILIGENQFLKTRKSGPNQPYPYYCTFCGVGFTLIKMFLAHKLNLQCREKKTGEVASDDVAGDRDGVEKNDVAIVPDEVKQSSVSDIRNEVEKQNIAGSLDEVEEDDLSDDPQLKIDGIAAENEPSSEQKTVDDAAEAGAREVSAPDAQLNVPYTCCKCKAKFETLGNLTMHIIRECFIRSAPTSESSTSTKKTKQELEPIEAQLPSGSDSPVMENNNYIYSNQTPSLLCSYCDKSFSYYFDLKRHRSQWCQPYEDFKRAHKGLSLTQKNICKYCSLKFKSGAALKTHVMIYCKLFKKRRNSPKKGKFKGKRVRSARGTLGKKRGGVKSGSKFQTKNALLEGGNNTENVGSEVTARRFESSNEHVGGGSIEKRCEICSCVFKYETDLVAHRFKGCAQSKAPDSKTCQVCGLKCLYESDLAIHFRNAHSGAATTEPDISDKTVTVNDKVTSSERVKVDEKKNQQTPSRSSKFRCPYCNLSFKSQSDVSTHKMLYCVDTVKTNFLAKDRQGGKRADAKSSDEAIGVAEEAKSGIDGRNRQDKIKGASSSNSRANLVCYLCGSRFCFDFALQMHQSKYCKIFYVPRKESKSADDVKGKTVNTSKTHPHVATESDAGDEKVLVGRATNKDDDNASEGDKMTKHDKKALVGIATNKDDDDTAEEPQTKKHDGKALVAPETNKDDDRAPEEDKIKKHDKKALVGLETTKHEEKTLEVSKTPKSNEAASTKPTIADTEKGIAKEAEVRALTESVQTIEASVKSSSAEKASKRKKSLITAPEVDSHEIENICGSRFEHSFALRKHKGLYCNVFNISDPQKTTKTNINEFDKFEEEKDYDLEQEDEQYGVFDLRDTLRRKAEFKKGALYRRLESNKNYEEELKRGKGFSQPVNVHRVPKNSAQHESGVQGLKVDSVTTLPEFEKTSFGESSLSEPRNDRSRSPLEKRFDYFKHKPHSNSRRYSTSPVTRHQLESHRRRREPSISSRHYSVSPSRKLRPRRHSTDHIPRRSYSSSRTIRTRKSNSPPRRSQQRRYSPEISTRTRSTSISPQRRIESFSRHHSSTSNGNSIGQSHPVRKYDKDASKAKRIYCEKCGDSIRSYQELLKPHCKHYKNVFPCPVCSLKFPDLNTLILHQDHAHEPDDVTLKELENSVEEIRYYCCACGMGFNFIKNLISHKILHHKFFHPNSSSTPAIRPANPFIRGYACRICNEEVFSSLKLLLDHELFSENHKRQLANFGHMPTNYAPVEHHKFDHVCYVCQLGFLTFRELQVHMLESSDHFLNESKSEEESSKTANYRHEQHSKPRNPEQSLCEHRATSQQTPITPEPKSSSIRGSSSDKMSSASHDSDVLPTRATSAPEYQVAYVMPSEEVEVQVTLEGGEEPFKRYFEYSGTNSKMVLLSVDSLDCGAEGKVFECFMCMKSFGSSTLLDEHQCGGLF